MSRESAIKSLIHSLFDTLKDKPRCVQEGASLTNFEAIFETLSSALSISQSKASKPSNTDVESFYRNTMPFEHFYGLVWEKLVQKNMNKFDANLDPLLTVSWNEFSSLPQYCEVCGRIPRLCSRQLWGIFNKLDNESRGLVDIEDVTDIILKMFFLLGREEAAENIHEWFCNQRDIDFWSLYSALVENHTDLLQAHVIHTLYEEVFHEIMKQGRMTKKGHKVASWKDRWFVLTSSSLIYYESLENRIQKGMITINKDARVEKLPPLKGRNYLFRITDGVSGTLYDICTTDPQMLQDWIEVIQVAIAVQTEHGRNLLHRLRLTRQKLFPQRVKGLPQYQQPVGGSIYNEGNFRVVQPTSKPRSLPTSPHNSSSCLTTPHAPSPGTSPDKEQPLTTLSKTTTPTNSTSSFTTTPNQSSTSPLLDCHTDKHPQPAPAERPIPTPRKKGPPVAPYKRNSLGNTQDFKLDHMDKVSPENSKTNSAIKSQSIDLISDYAQLAFDDEDSNDGGTAVNGPLPSAPPVIRKDVNKTRFDYSRVIVPDDTVKDVDAALKLKINRPPPEVPSKYEGGGMKPTGDRPTIPPRSIQSLTNGGPDVIVIDPVRQQGPQKSSLPTPYYVNTGFGPVPPAVPKRQESACRSVMDAPVTGPPPITPRNKPYAS